MRRCALQSYAAVSESDLKYEGSLITADVLVVTRTVRSIDRSKVVVVMLVSATTSWPTRTGFLQSA
jgi:hypothetical protein